MRASVCFLGALVLCVSALAAANDTPPGLRYVDTGCSLVRDIDGCIDNGLFAMCYMQATYEHYCIITGGVWPPADLEVTSKAYCKYVEFVWT